MLRLKFSKISLDRKDLDFHRKTHERRQATRGQNRSRDNLNRRHSKSPRSSRRNESPSAQFMEKKLAALPLGVPTYEQERDDSLISRDPVPNNSRAFWDKVLAEAGTPTRIQTTGSGNVTLVNPSEEWLEDHRSSRASLEEDRSLGIGSQDDQTPSDEIQDLSQAPRYQYSLDSVFPTHLGIPGDVNKRKDVTTSLESMQHPVKQSRLSNLFRRRPKSYDAVEGVQPQASTSIGLDGHNSDLQYHDDQDFSSSVGTSRGHSINDGLYGSRHDRRTISSSLETAVVHSPKQNLHQASERIQRRYTVSPAAFIGLPIDSRPPSGQAARSSLYVSEVAASTTPKESSAIPEEVCDVTVEELPSLLSLPPRRRKKYRPRSETYSYDVSEASPATTQARERPSIAVDISTTQSIEQILDADHALTSAKSFASSSSLIHANNHRSSVDHLTPLTQASHPTINQNKSIPRGYPRSERSTTPFYLNQSRYSSNSSRNEDLTNAPQTIPNVSHVSNHQFHGPNNPAQVNFESFPAVSQSARQSPTEMENHQTTSHNVSTSNASSPLASSRSSLSPFALPFMPHSTPNRNLTPQYPLPPPFSATPRTASSSHTMPTSSSPIAPVNASLTLTRQPSRLAGSDSQAIPRTPPPSSFTIYNDSEAPQTQPQTPADLQRRRRLYLYNTAPTRSHATRRPPAAIEPGIRRWQAFASPPMASNTPTRLRPDLSPVRMERMVSPARENQDAITVAERENRRAYNEGLRLGREEQRMLEMSPGLIGQFGG